MTPDTMIITIAEYESYAWKICNKQVRKYYTSPSGKTILNNCNDLIYAEYPDNTTILVPGNWQERMTATANSLLHQWDKKVLNYG